jgi:hypothetical protein
MTRLTRSAWKRRPRPRAPGYALDPLPLLGALGRSETEFAAALVIFAQERLELPWGTPIARGAFFACIRDALSAKVEPVVGWARNPFLKADFDALISGGWATDDGTAIALTPALREAVARYAFHDGRPPEASP